jgi:hypothetical protein
MLELKISENLKNLVRDKRVAFVGPAPYLNGRDLGSLIDNYDIVCRVNDIIPPEDIRADYGSRTDIMFHNLGTPWLPGLKRKIEQYPHAWKELKMVACPVVKSDHSETNYLTWADHYVSNVVRNFDSINVHRTDFSWIGMKAYRQLYSDIGVEFNSGLGGMMMLLNCPLKELFVTGFTFYVGGNQHDDLYYTGHWDTQDLAKTTVGINGGHGARANTIQIEYFQQMVHAHTDVLGVDSYVNNLLKLNHKNIREI